MRKSWHRRKLTPVDGEYLMPSQRDFLLQHCELDWMDTNTEDEPEDEETDCDLNEIDRYDDEVEWDLEKQAEWEKDWRDK